uniref:Vacuolar protein sorting-associated protein 13A n=1 Tax=Ascaris suum TaxID=6253 RepID=F1KPF0_ASCSU
MVFESVVADLLNRFLGDFVDNLDASQLNIGIWGGDVRLENLEVKETALDDLDLPVKLKFGYLSNLVLKIPWQSLYTEPVIANIEGLHLIVVPNKGVVYNEEKALKNEQDMKQKALLRLEENRKKRRKPPDPMADTFTEKLVAQVIKNLQITIRSIHVRYEDKFTNRHRPFAAGVTLEGLDFKTTDANWVETIHKETVQIVYKLVSLNSLAVYWNPNSSLISDLTDRDEIKRQMHAGIASNGEKSVGYKYILEPITMQTKLSMNQKPETDGTDWKTPKIDLKLDMEALALCVGKLQYQDLLLFLEAQERFNTATRYLKYRPSINEYQGHYKQWWHFAYTSILEENIRRKRNNWSWERMKSHRHLVRNYKEAWLKKQTEKNLSKEDADLIERAEKSLDVFNLNVARQQADMEIDRRGLTRVEDQPQGWVSWAKSWWGGTEQKKDEQKKPSAGDIVSQFEQAMTPEEKAKLFEAIDYQENTPPTDYPKHFVENVITVELKSLMVVIENALRLRFSVLTAKVQQRPSARAINIESGIKSVTMDGCGEPMLSMMDESTQWLSILVDTNPLDRDTAKYDQLVRLKVAPTLLKYHAPAINTAIDALRPPESVRLNQLTAAAMTRYEEVKTRSVTGLAHAVETKTKLVLDICIAPATIVISETGVFDDSRAALVTDLGTLTITTIEDDKPLATDIRRSTDISERMQELMSQAYDKFAVRLTNVQLILADNFSAAMAARNDANSNLHVLQPTGMRIDIHKSSIDDLQLPKMRILGNLPDVVVTMSDERLLQLLKLALSIPTPPPEDEVAGLADLTSQADFERAKLRDRAKMRAIMEADEIGEEVAAKEQPAADSTAEKKVHEQQVQLEMELQLNQVGVVIGTRDAVQLSVQVRRMGCKLQMRTFDMLVTASLGGLTIEQPQYKSLVPGRTTLFLVDTMHKEEDDLLQLKFVQANPESPLFISEYHSTEQAITITFKTLSISLHQEALIGLKAFGESLQQKVEEVQKEKPKEAADMIQHVEAQKRRLSRRLSQLSTASLAAVNATPAPGATLKEARRKRQLEEEAIKGDRNIKMLLGASFDALSLFIGSNKCLDTALSITTIRASLQMKVKRMTLDAGLRAITMQDRTGTTAHEDLLAVCGDKEMFTLEFIQYNRTDDEKKQMTPADLDMAVKCRFAQMRFVFLNIWLVRLLKWLEPFQAEAARAAAQAQAIAAEKATEAAQNVRQIMEQSPPRMRLDVELAAPTIVVPQKSTSLDALVFDLGKLSINNRFSNVREEPKAVIDSMDIALSDVNFAIGRLSGKSGEDIVSAKCQILEPLSFSLSLFRNLSFSWYKSKPEILVDAQLPKIHLNMSQEDYATIMKTLSGNLAEGGAEKAAPPPPAPVAHTASVSKTKEKETPMSAEKRVQTKTATTTPPTSPAEKSAKRIVFSFKMDEVAASLFSGSSHLEGQRGVVLRDNDAAFAAVRLMLLKVSGCIMEDGSMDVALSLGTFVMDDERRGATRITRLLDKKPDKGGQLQREFVGLRFEQNAKNDKIVHFSSSAFFLCLCPEFLGALASFFNIPKEEEDDTQLPEEMLTKTASADTAATSSKEVATPAAAPGTLTMSCKMREVEVVLIEDANKPQQTQALILSFNCDLDAKHEDGKQYLSGGIKNLQVVSAHYAPELRNNSPYQVLNRVEFGFKGTIEDASKSQNFEVNIGVIHLKFSPSIIRLLSAVSASFAAANQSKGAAEKERRPVLKKYPHYWEKKKVDRQKHWWFNVADEPEEDFEPAVDVVAQLDHREEATIRMESLVITLEAGLGELTVPVILIESSFNGVASDWSALLSVDAAVHLQVSYYNETFSVWEPVIEPVEVQEGQWRSWKINMEMRTHSEEEMAGEGAPPPPKQTVSIRSTDMLNITVTKSFLQLLNQLSDSFEKAAKQITPPMSRVLPGTSPYLVLNNTGISLKVASSLTLEMGSDVDLTDATAGGFVDLDVPVADKGRISPHQGDSAARADLRIVFTDRNTEREVNVMRAEIRTLGLPYTSDDTQQWKMVVETKLENSRRLIILRSAVQFVNHMTIPFEVYSMRDTMLDLCGIVEPITDPLDIALPLLYNSGGEFYVKPAGDGYETSNESICWRKFVDKARYVVRCDVSDDSKKCLYAALHVEEVLVKAERSREFTDKVYIVHIYPTVTLHNLLPFPLQVCSPAEENLAGGEEVALNVVPGNHIKLEVDYRGDVYVADMLFPQDPPDLDVVTLNSKEKELNLGVHWSTEQRRLLAQIYAPYWFVNNTGKTLKYIESSSNALTRSASCVSCRKSSLSAKADVTVVQEAFTEPALLPFSAEDFLNKKKAKVQVEGGQWSDEFPLDAVGNAGRITCKSGDREFEITLDVRLCQSGLTKVVCFSPFYLINNVSQFAIETKEFGYDEWIRVEPESCIGMWPRQVHKRKFVMARYAGTQEESIMFPFTENFEGFCQIDNEHLGVYATCSIGESSSVIRIEPFEPGMAPALVMNATPQAVEFAQKGSKSMKRLEPWESCMFTWTDVTRDRELEWKSGSVTHSDGLFMNLFDSYKSSQPNNIHYYWVSFLNGRQRVLLFTDDLAVMTMAHEAYEVERITQQIEFALHGIGISLVNNLKAEEVLYMGIASSAVIWEQLVKSRYKLLTVKQMDAVEKAFQEWQKNPTDRPVVVDKLEIDFGRMKLKKKKDETDIRRQFQTGLWMQYRQSPHQTQMHLKLNHLQVDNQLTACVFPCVLAVVAPPKSVVADNAPKPFMEFSFTMRQSEHSSVVQIKYLHLLVQEFSVQVDQGLINALLALFTNEAELKPYTKDAFDKDFEMTHNSLSQMAVTTTTTQQKAFYDDLHISPLMIHLSFSQGGSSGAKDKNAKEAIVPIQSEFVNVLLKSVGVTLTELQDVVFKLAFFERRFIFYNRQQLQGEIVSHYMKQAIKQLYVLVLGLDIIGNPFGLVRDLSTGVEDFFYQPFQGAIQGPEEFAEGVALGVKSLFGATVGGASGAVSRITGTLGKGVAALTLDEDYQRKRQQAINRRPQNFSEGMARGAKGVGQGFYEGITGVVSKPLEGARTGGVGGFAKGLGKGLVGAVVRPVSGVVDFASSSLDAVKTATSGFEETKPLRPPRVILSDNIVRPYSQKLALGAKIFKDVEHGAIADTDHFVAHAPITDKCVFIVTERRVLLVKRSDLVGSWGVEWQILFSEMKPPEVIEKGVKLELKKKQRGFFGMGASSGKVVEFHNKEIASEITGKLIAAYEAEVEGK